MTLLPYVLAFLMVLSAITYSRMESLKSLIPASLAFKRYIVEPQAKADYEAWEDVYKSYEARVVSDTGKENFINGCGKLNLRPIFAGDGSPPEKKKAYRELLSRLIHTLHHDEPYFIEAHEQELNWVDRLLDEMGNKQVKNLSDLNKLEFNDPLLNTMLYHLMKKNKSLAQYCTLSPQQKKQNVSIYLASKELLIALFQDQATVNEIHKERYRIYLQAIKENADMEDLKNEFASLKQIYPSFFDAYLSYDISKTRIPKDL